jgi:hypothetical protein
VGALEEAARSGNIRMLQYIKSITTPKEVTDCYFDDVVTAAVCAGKLETVKWLVDNGYPIGWADAEYAAVDEHYDILEYLISKGCKLRSEVSNVLVLHDRMDIFLSRGMGKCPIGYISMVYAAMTGNLKYITRCFSYMESRGDKYTHNGSIYSTALITVMII